MKIYIIQNLKFVATFQLDDEKRIFKLRFINFLSETLFYTPKQKKSLEIFLKINIFHHWTII